MKKKLGSKLAHGVRQVKLQREQESVASPTDIVPELEPSAKPSPKRTPARVAVKPVAPGAAQQPEVSLNSLHPSRIWPD